MTFLARYALGTDINEHQMIVCAPAAKAEPVAYHAVGQCLRIGNDLLLIDLKFRLQRLVEDLDAARDQATLLQEEVFAIQNEAINDRMYLLAIISAIFLPLGFLTGLFGINIGGMPGVEDPHAFWWFVGFLVVISLGLLFWMIRRRWFGNRASKAVRLGRLGILPRTNWLLRKK